MCGGDGTTCQPLLPADQPVTWPGKEHRTAKTFVWKETAYSECSVSCGIGEVIMETVLLVRFKVLDSRSRGLGFDSFNASHV